MYSPNTTHPTHLNARLQKRTAHMTKTISSTDAKLDWDSMISAVSNGDDVIVEVRGTPMTVMISFEEYQKVQKVREQQQRADTLEWLGKFEKEQLERNKDLTEAQVEEIALRVGREINAAAAARQRELSGRRNAE